MAFLLELGVVLLFLNRLNAQAQSKVISGGGATTKLEVYLASFLKKSRKVQTYRDKWFHKLNPYHPTPPISLY